MVDATLPARGSCRMLCRTCSRAATRCPAAPWRARGLVVGASGAHPWYDAACAAVVAELILALVQLRARDLRAAGALTVDG